MTILRRQPAQRACASSKNVMKCYIALDVVITEWAFQSYLELKDAQAFTDKEYWDTIRPNVELLKNFPDDIQFSIDKFWGPATLEPGRPVSDGFKMKWHNIGPGKVQLRLCVAILNSTAYLCQAFSKASDSKDKLEAAKLETRISLIRAGQYAIRGHL